MSTKTDFSPDGDVVVGCTPLKLDEKHAEEMMALAKSVPHLSAKTFDLNLSRFSLLVEVYHDDPTLLDPILVDLVQSLVAFVEFQGSNTALPSPTLYALSFLKALTHVRGYKTIIRFLPHELFVLPKLLFDLEYYASLKKLSELESQSVLMMLYWFIIVCRNPFDFHTFARPGEVSYPDRIRICLLKLRIKFMKPATLTLAETLTRHKENTEVLTPVIEECLLRLQTVDSASLGEEIADLMLLSMIFKKGKRHELQSYSHMVLEQLESRMTLSSENNDARLQFVKLLQQIAVLHLKPKPATWRYKCGVRSLEENLKVAGIDGAGDSFVADQNESDEGKDDEGGVVELDAATEKLTKTVLNCLLLGICDSDNDVRSSAAKGVGRIVARLPEAFADRVVSDIMRINFTTTFTAGHWHGGCMAVAELSQRGCILPSRLPEVMDIVGKALEFESDVRSTAVNVRDAACYICWAFARGFEKKLLEPYLESLAFKLVATALFDRSVNVRRAASAAFQENVGRNQSFPFGILVNTVIDYQAVGRIEACYQTLCLEVAQFGVYVQPLMDSLTQVFLGHWDEKIRRLAAVALHGLAKFDGKYCVETLLPRLVARLSETDVDVKQGALMSIGSILKGLFDSRNYDVNAIDLSTVKAMIPKLAAHFNSAYVHGSVLMLKAIAAFLESFAAIKLPMTDAELAEWLRIANRINGDLKPETRCFGKAALASLMQYFLDETRRDHFAAFARSYYANLEGREFEHGRIGAAAALEVIPKDLLLCKFAPEEVSLAKEVVPRLIALIHDKAYAMWFLARVAAIEAIDSIVSKVGVTNVDLQPILECIVTCMRDSTKTVQGLVGRCIRQAAIASMVKLLPLMEAAAVLEQSFLNRVITLMLEQACERIDGLREFAAGQLKWLLEEHCLPNIVERELLYKIFVSQKNVNWLIDAFNPLAPLLKCDFYRAGVLRGFINSSGGTTSGWVQNKGIAKLEHFFRYNPQHADEFFQVLLTMLDVEASSVAEVVIPINAFIQVVEEGCFAQIEREPEKFPAFTAVAAKLISLTYSKKLKIRFTAIAAMGVLLHCRIDSDLFRDVLVSLVNNIRSTLPQVRADAAKSLFEGLNTLDITNNVDEADYAKAVQILKDTDWRGAMDAKFKQNINELTEELRLLRSKHSKQPAS